MNLLERVRAVAPIGLDPCSNAESIVNAAMSYDITEDGLTKTWANWGLVYVNPPYGREITHWIAKCVVEAYKGVEIVALVPARTDTRWFQDLALKADQVLLMRGRVRFMGADHSAPFPSAVLYWGKDVNRFVNAFEGLGEFFQVRR